MRLRPLHMRHCIQCSSKLQRHHIRTRSPRAILSVHAKLEQKIHGKPNLEIALIIYFIDFIVREGNREPFDIAFQMLDLATPNDGIYIRVFGTNVGERDRGYSSRMRGGHGLN